MRLEFITTNDRVPVEVTAVGGDWSLEIDGRQVGFQAAGAPDGSWLVETHQGRRRLWVAARGAERLVFCDGRVHTLRLVDPDFDDDQPEGSAEPDLTAAMPGKVVKVLVAAGDHVAVGQALVIMESMKMETEVVTSRQGVVERIHVAAGQLVTQGEVLATLVAADSDETAAPR